MDGGGFLKFEIFKFSKKQCSQRFIQSFFKEFLIYSNKWAHEPKKNHFFGLAEDLVDDPFSKLVDLVDFDLSPSFGVSKGFNSDLKKK